jgi:DNA-binding MarR family transcriptional regulator
MKDRVGLITRLVIETFRLNGNLLTAGDRLVADIGLTSARWQVLGAIDLSPAPLTVAHIARNMGLSRQAVQRIVNELVTDGIVAFAPNPHHARAKLVTLTKPGARIFAAAMERQRPWVRKLGCTIPLDDVRTAIKVMQSLRARLEAPSPDATLSN